MPGFEPYLAFVRDDVFLKFNSRAYQDPNEKVINTILITCTQNVSMCRSVCICQVTTRQAVAARSQSYKS